MSISPGTERAIVRLSELAPRLLKELERLNANLEKRSGEQPKKPEHDSGGEVKTSRGTKD